MIIEERDLPVKMDDGVNLALDKLDTAKSEYKDAGVEYYQPWMVLMTDGEPTQDISTSVSRTVQMVNSKKLIIFPKHPILYNFGSYIFFCSVFLFLFG